MACPAGSTGLALAKGTFDASKITAFAIFAGRGHRGLTRASRFSKNRRRWREWHFLDATTVAAGDIASVKGAIDRTMTPQSLPATVALKVNQWSNSQDAWAISTVPPSSLASTSKTGAPQNPMVNAGQNVVAAGGGVKFGANVVFSGEAQCDTTQNATTLGDVFKLLINMAQMQAAQDPTAAALIKSVSVTVSGNLVKVMASLPQDTFQNMIAPQRKIRVAK